MVRVSRLSSTKARKFPKPRLINSTRRAAGEGTENFVPATSPTLVMGQVARSYERIHYE